MTLCYILLATGAISLVFYIQEKLRAYSLRAAVVKSVVSLQFIALAVCGWHLCVKAGVPCVLGLFVVIAQVLVLSGDIWLDLKYVYPKDDAPLTYAGFSVFGVGHVFYVAGLILQLMQEIRGSQMGAGLLRIVLTVSFALAVLAGFVTVALEKPLGLVYGKFKKIALVYGMLLFSTVFVSGGIAFMYSFSNLSMNVFFAGAVLFALSDLVLSGTYFGKGKDRPADIIANYILYYGGQFMMAYSLALLA